MSQMIESFMNEAAPAVQPVGFDAAGAQPHGAPVRLDPHPLRGLQVQLDVRVGTASVPLGELLQARENQVLGLDRTIDAPVDLLLRGQVVARGHLVAVDGQLAVRLSELPLPLEL